MKHKNDIGTWVTPHLHPDETIAYLYPKYVPAPFTTYNLGGAIGGPLLIAAIVTVSFVARGGELDTSTQVSLVALTLVSMVLAWGVLSIEWFASRGLPMVFVFTDQRILEFRFRSREGEIFEVANQREIPYGKVAAFYLREYAGLSYLVLFPFHETKRNRVDRASGWPGRVICLYRTGHGLFEVVYVNRRERLALLPDEGACF